ncbi:hypothetical protein EDB83DRAFT_2325127 [Lactarius deliciosus]|nr:hypothetical protein EDB83DRAFT_2325127 [Lactarius deliciosus]
MSTYEGPNWADSGQPPRAKIGQNPYPTLFGIIGGPSVTPRGDAILGEPRMPKPNASFYATTSSPVSAAEPSPPPPPAQYQPWMPPSGAANAAGRRVGGSWKVPLAVSRLASESPLPSCASSPKQAAV